MEKRRTTRGSVQILPARGRRHPHHDLWENDCRLHHLREALVGHMRLFAQGFLIVAFQAANVIAISRHSVVGAMAVSFALNALWMSNARAANNGASRWTYASGAACGAAIVVWLS